jgi:hypothetical protein
MNDMTKRDATTAKLKKAAEPIKDTPIKHGYFRDPKFVRTIVLRMGAGYLAELDKLCNANKRSRREIVEILVSEAALELRANPRAQISPIVTQS